MISMTLAAALVLGAVHADVTHVVDGDTLDVRARVWVDTTVETRVRIRDIDAPELRGKCPREKELAKDARDFVKDATANGVVLRLIEHGKYAGRVVARVSLPGGEDLAVALVQNGLARPYDGGKRRGWCETDKEEGFLPWQKQ